MQRSHRRSTKVCIRCRQRKTKCDFKFPACTSCKLAKANCQGFDPTTRKAVPRSLVRSLEARLAELEAQALALQTGPQNVAITMASKIAQANITFGFPASGSYLHSKVSSALIFRPSCPPLAVVRVRGTELDERRILSSVPEDASYQSERPHKNDPINLKSIPTSVISRMIRNYADTHLPQYPCITESMLDDIVRRVGAEELADTSSLLLHGIPADSGLGHFEYFVLFIVLAISAMTLTWKAEDQALSASESFYNSALKNLQVLGEHGEIKSLQISLLLAHYAHMCPQRVDNWTCISDAVRIVLNLGLHKESPEGLDIEQQRLRSTLFWVTYGMERSLSSNLRLPLSFPEEVITTKLDLSVDEGYDSLFTSEDLKRKSSANHIYLYRALETEVHRILHLQDDLLDKRGTTIEVWIEDVNHRLKSWYEASQVYTQYGMLEFKHVQYNHLRARIHRPTPRLWIRTKEDREIVLDSTLLLIDDYVGQEDRRRLFYPWHGVHILFETTVIALEACWTSRSCLDLRPKAEEMLETHIPRCLQLLAKMGQRWDEAGACAQRLSPLLENILEVFKSWESSTESSESAAITDEIQGLLYSDGSLTWNYRSTGSRAHVEEPNIFEDMVFEDLQFLQWAPEWDIMPMEMA